jgi:hypothetical protein
MKTIKTARIKFAEEGSEPTKEMRDFYESRTKKHIGLVGKYCKLIAGQYDEFEELVDRADVHDVSKFEEPERDPYIWITWYYKCKGEGKDFESPPGVDEAMEEASHHHVTSNSHHPEYHDDNYSGDDDSIVDATSMSRLDIAEMVADWSAMSEELGDSLKGWADKNVGSKWKFDDDQKDLIYDLVKFIESD